MAPRPPLRVDATGPPAGPEERFRALFAAHFHDLLGYALRRVSSTEDAADVVAETMLVAWRRLDEVPQDGAARLWLYGVARRVLANQRRGDLRRERLGERLRRQLVDVTPDLAASVASTATIRDALARLADGDRELLELIAWEGLTPQEVATVLGIPAARVRARLHKARARLRRELGDAFGTAGHVSVVRPRTLQEEEQ